MEKEICVLQKYDTMNRQTMGIFRKQVEWSSNLAMTHRLKNEQKTEQNVKIERKHEMNEWVPNGLMTCRKTVK